MFSVWCGLEQDIDGEVSQSLQVYICLIVVYNEFYISPLSRASRMIAVHSSEFLFLHLWRTTPCPFFVVFASRIFLINAEGIRSARSRDPYRSVNTKLPFTQSIRSLRPSKAVLGLPRQKMIRVYNCTGQSMQIQYQDASSH